MATDWSARDAALPYFEKQLKWAKQCNDDNKELIEAAVNALRRSQDHTAIQNKLNSAVKCIRSIAEMPASSHEIDQALCQEWIAANAQGKWRCHMNEPHAGAIDIGGGHMIEFVEYEGETAGINDWHRKQDGTWCRGWVSFSDSAWHRQIPQSDSWTVVQREPLTITPSMLCRACGDHGFITNGKWVPA